MMLVVVFIASALSSAALGYLTFILLREGDSSLDSQKELDNSFRSLKDFLTRIDALKSALVPVVEVSPLLRELSTLDQDLKNKNVKFSLASSELEAVEFRLQELEEIRREIEASATEIKDELRALQEREEELRSRREELEVMLRASAEKMSTIATELAMSSEMQIQIERMQGELVLTQEQCGRLLGQIEKGNEQCMAMKQRYNALDIEYALLYEKFARLESAR